ncbi:hypothetical protein KJ359_012565 [Pestalotiopsis sp. 9143b]|nr:hypothetical protein KJ359_012565 [Pestalotiopsis sp. 9143b]
MTTDYAYTTITRTFGIGFGNVMFTMTSASGYMDMLVTLFQTAVWVSLYLLLQKSPIVRLMAVVCAGLWSIREGLMMFNRYMDIMIEVSQVLSDRLFWVCIFIFPTLIVFCFWGPLSRAATVTIAAVSRAVRFLAPVVRVVMVVIRSVLRTVCRVFAWLAPVVMVVVRPVCKVVYFVVALLMPVVRPIVMLVYRGLTNWMSAGW